MDTRVQEFVERAPHATTDEARFFIEAHGNNVEAAIVAFLSERPALPSADSGDIRPQTTRSSERNIGVIQYIRSLFFQRDITSASSSREAVPFFRSYASEANRENEKFIDRLSQRREEQLPGIITSGFAHALDRAKESFKVLLVSVFSPNHGDSEAFLKSICSSDVKSSLDENFVLTIVNAQDR
mmetsp:Transcript_26709/g.68649  ORF Transcript_26709/g.68649 Transcript_26709/m.68649 type:complete len:184 (+) Transcript_26709:131-682(+)